MELSVILLSAMPLMFSELLLSVLICSQAQHRYMQHPL